MFDDTRTVGTRVPVPVPYTVVKTFKSKITFEVNSDTLCTSIYDMKYIYFAYHIIIYYTIQYILLIIQLFNDNRPIIYDFAYFSVGMVVWSYRYRPILKLLKPLFTGANNILCKTAHCKIHTKYDRCGFRVFKSKRETFDFYVLIISKAS